MAIILGTLTATGGTISSAGGRTIHTMEGGGTFTVTAISNFTMFAVFD